MKRKISSKNKSKSKIIKYTAVIPKTLKSINKVGTTAINKIDYFLKKSIMTLKKTTKTFDRRAARTIGSLTKKRSRK